MVNGDEESGCAVKPRTDEELNLIREGLNLFGPSTGTIQIERLLATIDALKAEVGNWDRHTSELQERAEKAERQAAAMRNVLSDLLDATVQVNPSAYVGKFFDAVITSIQGDAGADLFTRKQVEEIAQACFDTCGSDGILDNEEIAEIIARVKGGE